jgi:hypothetical protein
MSLLYMLTCFWGHIEKYEGQFFSPSNNPSKNGHNNTFDWTTSLFRFTILFVLLKRLVLNGLNFFCFYLQMR